MGTPLGEQASERIRKISLEERVELRGRNPFEKGKNRRSTEGRGEEIHCANVEKKKKKNGKKKQNSHISTEKED